MNLILKITVFKSKLFGSEIWVVKFNLLGGLNIGVGIKHEHHIDLNCCSLIFLTCKHCIRAKSVELFCSHIVPIQCHIIFLLDLFWVPFLGSMQFLLATTIMSSGATSRYYLNQVRWEWSFTESVTILRTFIFQTFKSNFMVNYKKCFKPQQVRHIS